MMRRTTFVVSVAALVATLAPRAGAQADSAYMRKHLITWQDAALAGAFTIATVSIHPFDKRVQDVMQDPERQKNRVLRNSAKGLRTIAAPGAIIIGAGMYRVGRLANNDRLAQLGLHGTEALLIGEAIGTVSKDFFGRARPWVDTIPNPENWKFMRGFTGGDKYHSFPSGHSVAGFAAAAAVTAETSHWWPKSTWVVGPAMYGGAALIGLSRMYDNRHWASDVIMGAAIGTFAGTKVVRYHRMHPDNKIDKWLLNASVSPSDLGHVSLSIIPLLR